jgi:hypothetical protein
MSEAALQRLRQHLIDRQVLVVVGAGVSIAATGSEYASWSGLIRSGIEQLKKEGANQTDVLIASQMADSGDLVEAAGWIRKKLGEDRFTLWLEQTVGALKPVNRELPEAVGRLNAPILTTNYDRVLEEVLIRQAVTWQNVAAFHRVVKGSPDVLHIHGLWSDTHSVVFDGKSYQRLLDDSGNQKLLHSAAVAANLLVDTSCHGFSTDAAPRAWPHADRARS